MIRDELHNMKSHKSGRLKMLPKEKIQFLLELMFKEDYELVKISQANHFDVYISAALIRENSV